MILTSSISSSMHHSTSELDGSLWFLPLLFPALCTTAPVSWMVHYDSLRFYFQFYAPQHEWVVWFTMILTSSISSSMHHSTSELAVSSQTSCECLLRNSELLSYFCNIPYCFTNFSFSFSNSLYKTWHDNSTEPFEPENLCHFGPMFVLFV